MKVMPYQQADLAKVVGLFQAAVHGIDSSDYSKAQRTAWASPAEIDRRTTRWDDKLGAPYTILVKDNTALAGFVHYTAEGYLDLLFVHPNYQRMGIAKVLVLTVESALREMGVSEISTEASITARPFFEALGYQVIKEQFVQKKNQILINYQMKKILL